MAMHELFADGYSTTLKTTVRHSPEFWIMIDRLFALDALIDVGNPTAVTTAKEFETAFTNALRARSAYSESISSRSPSDLRNALYLHFKRIELDEKEEAP
jgi:hypothetical protein